jgi:dTDP-4-dehydrorhamnose 3,5-epimerase
MKIRSLTINGVLEITPLRHIDERGFFSETWNRRSLAGAGLDIDFVQDNQSLSASAGTLRGLHFQIPPRAQAKLVRVGSGSIFDVAVDIRKGSPTFGHWISVELSRERWNQLLIPAGFAHGYVTLVPNTEVAYKVSDYHSPEHDRTIRFDDPTIGIVWPDNLAPFQLSAKDERAPLLANIDTGFVYNE